MGRIGPKIEGKAQPPKAAPQDAASSEVASVEQSAVAPSPDAPAQATPAPNAGITPRLPIKPKLPTGRGTQHSAMPANPMICPRAMRAIAPKLAPGEQVLWAGKPKPSSIASMSFGWAILFSPMLLLWKIFKKDVLNVGSKSSMSDHDPVMFWAMVIGVLSIGCGIAWIALQAKAKKVSYALTDKRAILLVSKWGIFGENHVDLGPGELNVVSVTEKSGGRGHLVLTTGLIRFASGAWLPKGFLAIEKPRAVAELVKQHPLMSATPRKASWYSWFLTRF